MADCPPESTLLSVVVPVFDERENLEALHAELREVAAECRYELDMIFVDDGSRDGSWEVIASLAARDPQVRGIRFRRNFGKAAALSAGFAEACGELVMTLDADLQDDPREIPRFLAAMAEGRDVVSGWKQTRYDPWHKVYPSRVFNWMVSRLTGVCLHDHNCGMKCYRRQIFDEVQLYGELHRFVPVLAAAWGYRVGEVVIQHRPRRWGRSKYGLRRFLRGFLDLLTVKFLTGFAQRPQHLLGTVGLVSFVLGLAGLGHIGLSLLTEPLAPALGWFAIRPLPAAVFSMALLLLGGQLMAIGFLAELFIAYHAPRKVPYSIAERTAGAAGGTAGDPRDPNRTWGPP